MAVKEYVKYDCTNKINEIILSTINNEVVDNLTNESLMHVTYNDSKEVVYAYIDTKKTNEILGKTAEAIINLSSNFNENNTDIQIPLGYLISDSVFFANTLRVPISVSNISKYNVKLDTVVTEYGINSSLVAVNLVFEFEFKTMIPFVTDDLYISNQVPLLTTVLYGEVPNYFFSGETPNVSIQ